MGGAERVVSEIPDKDGIDSTDKDVSVREPVCNRFIVSIGMLHAGFCFAVKAFDQFNERVDSGLSMWDIAGRHKDHISGSADGDSWSYVKKKYKLNVTNFLCS